MIPPGMIPAGCLVAIDWSWWTNRAYHAAGVDGMLPVLVGRLAEILRTPAPSHLVVAVDSVGATWRHDAYPAYKSGREPKPAEFYEVQERALEIVRLYGIPVLDAEGFEADDVIAAVVDRARDDRLTTAMLSPDKDLLQLVDADVCAWDGAQKVRWPGDVQERTGVAPEQIPDWLAITGDAGDAVPGVPGLGEKRAAWILQSYGTVLTALDATPAPAAARAQEITSLGRELASKRHTECPDAEEVSRLRGRLTSLRALRNMAVDLARLQAHREQVLLARQLVTLRADAPVEWSEESARVGGGDRAALADLYRSIGWYRLANEVGPAS